MAKPTALRPIDESLVILKQDAWRLGSCHVLAMAPFAVVFWWWLNAISAHDRAGTNALGIWLVAATLWRWSVLAWGQIQTWCLLQNLPAVGLWAFAKKLPGYLLARLTAHGALLIGSMLIVPGLWGWGASLVLAPVHFAPRSASDDVPLTTGRSCTTAWRLATGHTNLLGKQSLVWGLMALVMGTGLMVCTGLLVKTILPQFFGMDTSMAAVALGSAVWLGFAGLVLFAMLDVWMHTAGVCLLAQWQAQANGHDLLTRLRQLSTPAEGGPT